MKKILSTALALILAATMLASCAPADKGTASDKNITTYTTEGKVTKLVGDPNATGELTVDVLYEYSKDECAAIEKMYKNKRY